MIYTVKHCQENDPTGASSHTEIPSMTTGAYTELRKINTVGTIEPQNQAYQQTFSIDYNGCACEDQDLVPTGKIGPHSE